MGRLVCLVAVLALLGPASSPAATGIIAVGDFGVGGPTERAIGTAMRTWEARHPAELLVTLGDNDYTRSPSRFHTNWISSFGWLAAAGVRPAGTLGNHDVEVQRGRYEFDELDMPRAFYRRQAGPVELFILNSNTVGDRQTAWLRHRLAASTSRWKVAVLHHPPFTCGGYLGNAAVRSRWVPLFARYGVDLVLSGHDHNYQRFRVLNGVRYVVHGGGASLYALSRCPSSYPRRLAARAVRGFLDLRAGERRLLVRAVTRTGRVLDRLAIYP